MPYIVGVRLDASNQLVFGRADNREPRGRRVRVQTSAGDLTGTIAVAAQQIIAAPPLADAPRIVAADDGGSPASNPAVPTDVAFLLADDTAIGPTDLARALHLAVLPLPEPPPERGR